MRFGGPGACRAVPDVRGESPLSAERDITAAGFAVGDVGTRFDPFCENLDNVVGQTPSPGTQLALGGRIDYEIGIPPRNGCPIPH
jgi:beta-lactam-binding protein with PASTA domain